MRNLCQKNKGFTLLELVVTLSIFTLLTIMMTANYRQSNRALTLKVLTNRVATHIRQAQVYSIATVGDYLSYGIYVNQSNNTSIKLFADVGPVGYDNAAEIAENLILKEGNTILKLCVNMKKDNKNITNCDQVNTINILFTRPYPEPIIIPSPLVPLVDYADAEIILKTSTGETRTVVVSITGQISIE